MEHSYAHTYNSAGSMRLPLIDWNIRFFGAHMQTVNLDWSVEKESHRAFEIIYVFEGSQETLIENEGYVINSGDIMLIPPGLEHINRSISFYPMTYFCAHFDIDEPSLRIEMLKNCELIYTPTSPFYQRLRGVLEKWFKLFTISDIEFIKYKLQIQLILFELLEVFVDIVSVSQKNKNLTNESMTITKYAKEIAEAIKSSFRRCYDENETIASPIHIQPIIASLGLSPNYGLEIFQRVYHMSPRKYLSDLKLQQAKMLIQQPNISLTDISNRLGYKNQSHFSRQFKRWTGISPSEFRNKSNNK